ncbi:MAG: DUF4914 family protein [Defluviitaleaceae bacterium]|nr:DUF4914 family protein [Defluviitaleaceae bacterium]
MSKNIFSKMILPQELKTIITQSGVEIAVPEKREDLLSLALGGDDNMTFDVSYEVEGAGLIPEATVIKCKNGAVVNYADTYMRRRDPDSMVIADELPTDKPRHEDRFGFAFNEVRNDAFDWLSKQKKLLVMPFLSGNADNGLGYPSILIAPANAAFFGAALADIQGFIPMSKIPNFFKPKAIIYVVPPFRHKYYDGKQIVVHNRLYDTHELFSFNLYPGPSAKKGIYGVLLNLGEQEKWLTLHGSTVRVITPYELMFTILHEGASGGGKSEMIENFHRERDGRVLLGTNVVNNERFLLTIMDASELHPVTDDMAVCHPSLQGESKKLVVADAEEGWFLRVNHITHYGMDFDTEKNTIHPPAPLLFLNMAATPGSTCLIWEPYMDEPDKPCPNPRVIMPRRFVQNHVNEAVEVDVRSFGIRTPPCTREHPTYGIVGIFHVLPPALAWLWRLAAPRGHDNPSIVDKDMTQLTSEGVGSYWPFATGRMVDQANLLLEQILKTPATSFILIPNQHIGAYKVGFFGQWMTREYLARRGGMHFRDGVLTESRCPLLGYALESMKVDGTSLPKHFMQVQYQPEVGGEAYDIGAKILTSFFKNEIKKYLSMDLMPMGKRIVEACLNDARVTEYYNLIPRL